MKKILTVVALATTLLTASLSASSITKYTDFNFLKDNPHLLEYTYLFKENRCIKSTDFLITYYNATNLGFIIHLEQVFASHKNIQIEVYEGYYPDVKLKSDTSKNLFYFSSLKNCELQIENWKKGDK